MLLFYKIIWKNNNYIFKNIKKKIWTLHFVCEFFYI